MKKHIFSLAYLTVPGTHPVDQIEIAAQCGYEGVGLRFISQQLPGEPHFDMSERRLFETVRAALSRTGVKLYDIELARVVDGVDVSFYEKQFALAAELGAEYTIASVWTDKREFALKQLEEMCDLAGKYGLKVNLEFMSFSAIRTLEEALETIRIVDRPNLKLMIDHLHAHRAGVYPMALSQIPKEQFGFVHLCDGPLWVPPLEHPDMTGVARSGRLYVGEGGVRIREMIEAMPDVPYYSIELPNAEEMAMRGKAGHAARCLETAKAFFEENGL